MNKKNRKIKNIVVISLVILLLVSFIGGFFQVNKQDIGVVCNELTGNLSFSTRARNNINKNMNTEQKPASEEKEESDKNITDLLFLLSSIVTLGSTPYLVLFVIFMGAAGFCILKSDNNLMRRESFISKLRYYKEWYIKFMSPVEKSMRNRADEYDINPMKRVLRGKNPHFALDRQNAGFFYWKIR